MTDERFEPATTGDEVDPEAERIVSEIEVTRTEMGGTINEIGHRLDPQVIAGQARDHIREATVGKVERMMDDAGQTAQRTGDSMIETIRQNPVPAAIAALGLGWLALKFRDQQSSVSYGGNGSGYRDRYLYQPRGGYSTDYGTDYGRGGYAGGTDPLQPARDAADRVTTGAQDVASQAVDRAQQLGSDVQQAAQSAVGQTQEKVQQAQWQVQGTVGQAQRQFDRTLNENPLAVAALAVGVGAAVALAIPETQKERELLGEQRDKLVSQAEQVAAKALDQTEQRVQEVGEQLRSES